MGERVQVLQNSDFQIQFLAADPELPDSDLKQVSHLHQLTPYGMLLVSLASCTTIVLHTYARAHDIKLNRVVVNAEYERSFNEDCENCEENNRYDAQITEHVELHGELSGQERKKLENVVKLCSIRQMLEGGIEIQHVGTE